MLDDLLSPMHLVVLGIVVLMIFGPKRLPEIGAGFGKALRGFKDAVTGEPARAESGLEVTSPKVSPVDLPPHEA
jgi:sec-independent protein translocase protein TatA